MHDIFVFGAAFSDRMGCLPQGRGALLIPQSATVQVGTLQKGKVHKEATGLVHSWKSHFWCYIESIRAPCRQSPKTHQRRKKKNKIYNEMLDRYIFLPSNHWRCQTIPIIAALISGI